MAASLKLIEQALVLAEAGTFARAAERLGISQPTLSRNMAALESTLRVRLFDRGRGGAEPTVFGRAVVARGGALIGDMLALESHLRELAGLQTGQLDIVAGPYVAEDLVAPAIARLVNECPGLRVRATVARPHEVGPAVLARQCEIGLVGINAQAPHDELSIVALRRRRLFIACRPGHPLAGTAPTSQQVLSYPLVGPMFYGEQARAAADGDDASAGEKVRRGFAPSVEVNSLDAAKRIARESDALLPATAAMLSEEITRGMLVTLAFDRPELRARPVLVRLKNRAPSPAALRFLALLRVVEEELVAAERAEHTTA